MPKVSEKCASVTGHHDTEKCPSLSGVTMRPGIFYSGKIMSMREADKVVTEKAKGSDDRATKKCPSNGK